MKFFIKAILVLLLPDFLSGQIEFGNTSEDSLLSINERMMNSTFRIEGVDSLGLEITGTCFVVKRKNNNLEYDFILITVNHVLLSITNDFVMIFYPGKKESEYVNYRLPIRIKNNGLPLWKTLDDTVIDIATLKINSINFQSNQFVSIDYFANENDFERYQIRPGDKLFCIGYPEGASSNKYGFPILKSGVIASYPIFPTKEFKYFLFDCEVFPASSGSPVLLAESGRYYYPAFDYIFDTNMIQFICGIIVSKEFVTLTSDINTKDESKNLSLQLAKVIPSTFILETIELLYAN